jgi:Ca-activated chloride channel family protein
VNAYRLIGYENRLLNKEDFNDDKKDAGEIGAGHSVTALYEIVPTGVEVSLPTVDPLKYQRSESGNSRASSAELMHVKIRYKEPDGSASRLMQVPVANRWTATSDRLGFAAAVAQFGMLLRRSDHRGAATWESTASLARRYRGADPEGYRAEFLRLVGLAGTLARQAETSARR